MMRKAGHLFGRGKDGIWNVTIVQQLGLTSVDNNEGLELVSGSCYIPRS